MWTENITFRNIYYIHVTYVNAIKINEKGAMSLKKVCEKQMEWFDWKKLKGKNVVIKLHSEK